MSEAYLTNWALNSHFDDRDHFHHVALQEARVASERRTPTSPATEGTSLISRLRLAIGRPGPAVACDCPAAA